MQFWHYLKRFGNEVKILKTRSLKLFSTIFATAIRKQFWKTRTVNGTFSRHLKQFGNGVNILKTRTLNGACWRHLKLIETAEQIRKTVTVNGAFWQYLKRFQTAEITLKQRCCPVHYDIFLKTIFEIAMRKTVHVVTLSTGREKGRPQPGTFENKDSDWCILTDAIWKDILAIPKKFWRQER